jgi:hypothetical protein
MELLQEVAAGIGRVTCCILAAGIMRRSAHNTLLCVLYSFRNGRQEDAHEYLIALLDAMHTMALGGPGVKVKPEEAAAKSLIYRIFAGKMRSTVRLLRVLIYALLL